jgi:hypothetical protein
MSERDEKIKMYGDLITKAAFRVRVHRFNGIILQCELSICCAFVRS